MDRYGKFRKKVQTIVGLCESKIMNYKLNYLSNSSGSERRVDTLCGSSLRDCLHIKQQHHSHSLLSRRYDTKLIQNYGK